jgi:pyruvate dehydrogenase (quinone)
MVGDGAMQMNGISGLITIAKVWRQWLDPKLVVMVLNNGDLNQVTWEQRAMSGDPKFEDSQMVPDFPYAQYGQMLGLRGRRVERTEDIGAAWDEALTSDRPFVLEMVTDPNVPPLPPHISLKQAKAYMSALMHGDADALGICVASAKEWWASVFPAKRAD